jgi:hypothetical protein
MFSGRSWLLTFASVMNTHTHTHKHTHTTRGTRGTPDISAGSSQIILSISLSIYLSRARALSLYHIRVIRPVVFLPYEEDLCPDANEYSMLTATMAREQKF